MHARISRLVTQALCKPRELPSPSPEDAASYVELWEELCGAGEEMGAGSSTKVVTCCLSLLLRVLLPLGHQLSAAPKACVKQLFVSHGAFALAQLQAAIDAAPAATDAHECAAYVELLLSALRHRDVLTASHSLQAAVAAAAAPLVSSLVPMLKPAAKPQLLVQICRLVTALVTAAQTMPVVHAGLAAVDAAAFSAAAEKAATTGVMDNVRGTCSKLQAAVAAAAAAAVPAAAEPRKRRRP